MVKLREWATGRTRSTMCWRVSLIDDVNAIRWLMVATAAISARRTCQVMGYLPSVYSGRALYFTPPEIRSIAWVVAKKLLRILSRAARPCASIGHSLGCLMLVLINIGTRGAYSDMQARNLKKGVSGVRIGGKGLSSSLVRIREMTPTIDCRRQC